MSARASLFSGLLLAVLLCTAGQADARASTAWVTVRTPSIHVDYGNLPARIAQTPVGRLRLDHVVRLRRTTVHGRTVDGDLLVVSGEYRDIYAAPSNWIEGIAFYLGVDPKPCAPKTCGPVLPHGDWWTMGKMLAAPLVDYPRKQLISGGGNVSFRIVFRLDAHAAPKNAVRDMSSLWLLPEYNIVFDSLPFLHSQIINLASYFGTRTLPQA